MQLPGALTFLSAPGKFLTAQPSFSLLLGRWWINLGRLENLGLLGNQINNRAPPKTALGGALRVGATPGALRVGAVALPKTTPLHVPCVTSLLFFKFRSWPTDWPTDRPSNQSTIQHTWGRIHGEVIKLPILDFDIDMLYYFTTLLAKTSTRAGSFVQGPRYILYIHKTCSKHI